MCKYQEHFDSPLHDPFKKESALIQVFFLYNKNVFCILFFPPEKQPMAMEDAETYHWSFRRSDGADPETGYLRSWWRGSRATTAAGLCNSLKGRKPLGLTLPFDLKDLIIQKRSSQR